MNTQQKIRHLELVQELFQGHATEILDSVRITSEFLAKEGYPTITSSRLKKLEELLRGMANRCVRLADEVETIEG